MDLKAIASGLVARDDRGIRGEPKAELGLITNIETTPAVAADVDQTAPIHAALAAKGLLPGDHLLDAGFVDVQLLVGSQFEHGVRLVGPMRPDVSWQAQANQGFDIAHFTIDWEAKRVTCPEGKTSVLWKPGQNRWGNEVIHTEFARHECPCYRTAGVRAIQNTCLSIASMSRGGRPCASGGGRGPGRTREDHRAG